MRHFLLPFFLVAVAVALLLPASVAAETTQDQEWDPALEVSRAGVPDVGADGVVAARSDIFADALVGGPLAGVMGGPVLLSETATVEDAVVEEARRVLRPGGAVYLMGGHAALSPEVEARFLAAGMRVHRVSGTNRFDTAVQAANLVNPAPTEILLASGENFADALSPPSPTACGWRPATVTRNRWSACPPRRGPGSRCCWCRAPASAPCMTTVGFMCAAGRAPRRWAGSPASRTGS